MRNRKRVGWHKYINGVTIATLVTAIFELPLQASNGKLAAAPAVPSPDAVARPDDAADPGA